MRGDKLRLLKIFPFEVLRLSQRKADQSHANIIESKIIPIKALLILLLCFKSFCLRHDVARNSTKFIISSKLILQILSVSIFYKKLLNICHPNGYRVVPSFRMDSKVLEAPTLLNHMTFFGNFVFGKCYSISKRLCLPFSKKYSLSFH